MLFGISRHSLQAHLPALARWRVICSLLIAPTAMAHAADISTPNIESAAGQPFRVQLPLENIHPDTDLSCFSLQQAASADPIQLEYTTLGSQKGVLLLWSHQSIASAQTVTLIDRCKPSRHALNIQADNSLSVAPPGATQPAASAPAQAETVADPDTASLPAPADPGIPLEAYQALQQQVSALQDNFSQLQAKSDALYASEVAHTQILATLKNQLIQLQNENHLLRTLTLTLGLMLFVSGFFFADWLRRYATLPKSAKSRDKPKERGQPESTQNAMRASDAPPSNAVTDNAATLSQGQTSRAVSRLKSVPLHANDDEVSPHGEPHKISSQQSTNAVMQDASRLFTHGRINQAIEHLQQHLARHPKCSPWMWLYLLDLLSKEGKQQEFDVVAGECRKHFNLSVERNPDLKQQGIESYPRIMKALQQTWGTPQVISLIDDLIYNTRLVPRMGFERSVFEEMMLLKEIACQTQNLPTVPLAAHALPPNEPMDNLRELQQLSGDIYILAPVDQTPFHYWTDFAFELDEPSTLRKSA